MALPLLIVVAILLGVALMPHTPGSSNQSAIEAKSAGHVVGTSLHEGNVSSVSAVPIASDIDEGNTSGSAPYTTTRLLPATTVSTATQDSAASNDAATSSQQSEENVIVNLHIGGYPPAVSAVLGSSFDNPTHVPCNMQQYPQNTNCSFNSYQWVASKYCVYTYADGHLQKQLYQYQAYGDIYANPDGSLNPSGINMAVYSEPTYSCNVASAPKSVFEPNWAY